MKHSFPSVWVDPGRCVHMRTRTRLCFLQLCLSSAVKKTCKLVRASLPSMYFLWFFRSAVCTQHSCCRVHARRHPAEAHTEHYFPYRPFMERQEVETVTFGSVRGLKRRVATREEGHQHPPENEHKPFWLTTGFWPTFFFWWNCMNLSTVVTLMATLAFSFSKCQTAFRQGYNLTTVGPRWKN